MTTQNTIPETEILETIDCTPTWQSLLPMMLEVFAQKRAKTFKMSLLPSNTQIEAGETCNNLFKEFKRMAEAADKWNSHCKDTKTV